MIIDEPIRVWVWLAFLSVKHYFLLEGGSSQSSHFSSY